MNTQLPKIVTVGSLNLLLGVATADGGITEVTVETVVVDRFCGKRCGLCDSGGNNDTTLTSKCHVTLALKCVKPRKELRIMNLPGLQILILV